VLQRGGCRLVHNHPSQGSLSQADWSLALAEPGIAEIVAVNSGGTTFRGEVIDWPGLHAVVSGLNAIRDRLEQVASNLASGRPSEMNVILRLEPLWSHLLNERLAAKGLLDYEIMPCADDATTLTCPRSSPYLADALARMITLLP